MPTLDSTTAIAGWLTSRVASYLDTAPDEVDPDQPLADYGLDSVYALSLCGEIEDELNLTVEPTLAWDYPTVNAMAGYLHGELAGRVASQ
ncbi:MAG TPA: acyl carrier protein [Pseudonocardiaceae bacterium]|jgi:acyl carrier protein